VPIDLKRLIQWLSILPRSNPYDRLCKTLLIGLTFGAKAMTHLPYILGLKYEPVCLKWQ
jgi:hypothetical protein